MAYGNNFQWFASSHAWGIPLYQLQMSKIWNIPHLYTQNYFATYVQKYHFIAYWLEKRDWICLEWHLFVCVINVIFLLCERGGKSDNAVIFGYTCDKLYHKITWKLFFDDNTVVVNCLILIDEVCFPQLTSLHVEGPLDQLLDCLLQLRSNSLVMV
jgi:hypothetical protein